MDYRFKLDFTPLEVKDYDTASQADEQMGRLFDFFMLREGVRPVSQFILFDSDGQHGVEYVRKGCGFSSNRDKEDSNKMTEP